MSRIRVLRVITRLNIGGPAIHAAILTSQLDPSRYESVLVSGVESPNEGSMLELGRLPEVHPVIVQTLGRAIAPTDDIRALGALLGIARRFKPHIVHTHLAKAGALGRLAARLARVPVVLHTYHGSVFEGYFGQRESAVYLTLERVLSRMSTRVIAITPSQRIDLLKLGIGSEGTIVEIRLGLDLDQFRILPERSGALTALGLDPSRRYVALVARLVPIKDVGTFLRSLGELVRFVPEAHGLVVGDGAERGALRALASELGIEGRCTFLGWRADMPNVYAASDVVVLTSLNEGSPVSLIEAMASGRPVVATAVGGIPDVMSTDVGTLVPPRAPTEIAVALADLLRNDARRRSLGLAARELAYARYDRSRLVSDIDALYTTLLADRGLPTN